MAWYGIVWYSILLVLHCMVLFGIVLYCSVLHSILYPLTVAEQLNETRLKRSQVIKVVQDHRKLGLRVADHLVQFLAICQLDPDPSQSHSLALQEARLWNRTLRIDVGLAVRDEDAQIRDIRTIPASRPVQNRRSGSAKGGIDVGRPVQVP